MRSSADSELMIEIGCMTALANKKPKIYSNLGLWVNNRWPLPIFYGLKLER